MKYKNYYKILDLKSSKASDEEIKSAYRKLAKLYHPDLNVGNSVISDKFKEINEAYQVLGNQATRKKYDMIHFAHSFKNTLNKETMKERINAKSGAKDFVNLFFGEKNAGESSETKSGSIQIKGENQESEIDISLEEAFFGGERKIAYKTPNGKLRTIVVNIPKGLKTGEVIRLSGQGKPGKNGGNPGDMLIKINILPHERFEIKGADLITKLPITPWEAALGDEIDVYGIDFNVKLTVPAGTTTGEVFRIPNGGYYNSVGGRGDLLIIAQIMLPKRFTDKEKDLFLKFKEISSYNPRGMN